MVQIFFSYHLQKFFYIYVTCTYTGFKTKIYNHQVRQVFRTGISTSKNLFKEIEKVNSNAPGRSTDFEQILVGWDEIYLQNEKFKRSLYNHFMKSKTK